MDTTEPTKKERTPRFNMVADQGFFDRVKEIQTEEHLGSIAEAIRYAVTRYYKEIFRKETFGYQAGTKVSKGNLSRLSAKDQLEENIENMKNMNDEELSKYLVDIGFSSTPKAYTTNMRTDNMLDEFVIRTDMVTQARGYYFVQRDIETGKEQFCSHRFTWDELISALKKEKFI